MKRIIIAVALAFGFTSAAVAQDIGTLFVQITSTVVGTVAGNVIVSGMDGVSCGATAGINAAIRKNNYGGYQHDSDYQQCLNMQQSQRMQAYYMRMAMEQQERAIAMQNAPRTTCRAERRVDEQGRGYTTEVCDAQITRGGYRNW